MSSSVFFRFKSQKEPSRVTFDGTGISVFELKREIITINKLGDGLDFELVVCSEDNNEVYDDDTSIIPRSTTVIAKRLPPAKPGRGGAARYVSGTMPQSAKNTHRSEIPAHRTSPPRPSDGFSDMRGAQTEEQRVAAMFKMGADQWAQQQQEMASATPVHRSGPNKGKPTNVPDHPPPPGYICYRCGEKGHWIQVCPTNDDPAYENRPRVKRTTGIPRSFLKTVEKPTSTTNDGTVDDTKQPAGVMVNAEGEWVVAEPDKAAWDEYQAKTKVSAAAQEAANQGNKELQGRGLECSMDKRLFLEPTKTPCCQTTFCRDCITNALIENDLHCPQCSTENILIDDLKPDEAMSARIRRYEEEQSLETADNKNSQNLVNTTQRADAKSPTLNVQQKLSSLQKGQPNSNDSKKRPAESELMNDRTAHGSNLVITNQPSSQIRSKSRSERPAPNADASKTQPLPITNAKDVMPPGMNAMAYSGMNTFMPFGMNIPPAMTSNQMFQPPMTAPNGTYMGNDWSNMYGTGFQQQAMNLHNGNFRNVNVSNGAYPSPNNFMNMNGMTGLNGINGRNAPHHGRGSFANQQRSTNDEDSAYFRMPVNPHRHQTRRNVPRPTDYREI